MPNNPTVQEDGMPPGVTSQQEYIRTFAPIVEAWDSEGWIDNANWGGVLKLKNDYMKAVMAVCLENTRKLLMPQSEVYSPKRDGAIGMTEGLKKNVRRAMELSRQAVLEGNYGPIAETTTPVTTTAMSGATNLPLVLGYVRKILPKMFMLNLVNIQPMSLPTGRVFVLTRQRHNNGTDVGNIANRAGWSFRSFDDTPGEATAIVKTLRFALTSEDVSAGQHKLMTEVGVEIEQDLRAYHGIDAGALVSDGATTEMAIELDERLLYQMWAQASAGTFVIGAKPAAFTQSEWDRRYLEVIVRANESIWTNQRVNPRYLVLGSDWAVQLSNIYNTFMPTPTSPAFDQLVGQPSSDFSLDELGGNGLIQPAMNIGNFIAYKASLPFPTAQGLVVHKGTSWVDAAMFYLPYVPVQIYSIFRDPVTQKQQISWISRYATYYVGTNFNGANRVALIKIDLTGTTGTSYPAFVESTGGQ